MKRYVQILILSVISAFSLSAFAYPTGKFECKNTGDLPNNIYEISDVALGGGALPFVKVQRHYKGRLDANGQVTISQSEIEGIAIVSKSNTDVNRETLMLAQMRLEFVDGELFNCKKPE